jgi:exosortase
MAEASLVALLGSGRRHLGFALFVAISAFAFHGTLKALIAYSLRDPSSSHIILIPLISLFLLYTERMRIFQSARTNTLSGFGLVLCGAILFWLANRGYFSTGGNWPLSVEALSIVIIWVGGFLLFYGVTAFQAAAFPLLFLLLMVPLPDVILNRVIYELQEGSTQIAQLIFQAVGTPVLRHGFLLSLPGVTIEVAQECSSIRSSVALFITCLIAAHLYLRTWWKILLLLVVGLLLSVVKNGIRIATLTLLSMYVDPGFLTGRLHHEGGFVFFFLALLMLWPLFLWLERSDRHQVPANVSA